MKTDFETRMTKINNKTQKDTVTYHNSTHRFHQHNLYLRHISSDLGYILLNVNK